MLTDEALIALYFSRSETAISETMQKYGTACGKIAYQILHNTADAEESVNDTLLAAWNTIPPKRPSPLRAYLFRIVRNIATSRFHKNTAQKRGSGYDVALDELENCLSSSENPDAQLSAAELTRQLTCFLDTLDKESRILFMRRYWYGKSVQELAQESGCKPNTITVRLSRTRKKLRLHLKKEGIPV